MKNSIKIAMLGGDRRQIMSAVRLSERYDNINIWGVGEAYAADCDRLRLCRDPEKCLDGARVVVLPLPASSDGTTLNSPLAENGERLKLSALVRMLPSNCLVIGGKIPEAFVSLAEEAGISVIDYFDSEDFQIKNAYTTAEAALSIAMNTLDKNILGSRVAVTGYGRIAKHLCRLLLNMGASVTVAARNPKDLLWAQASGCETLMLDKEHKSLSKLQSGYDVIYNTVPFWLFDREYLKALDKNTFIVDLASAPGGVDIRAARELGSNVNWATSLPGKYAPRSAGELIADCVGKLIETEVDSP